VEECGALARRAERVVTAAFIQACREEGIGPHPGGACPAPGCPCQDEQVCQRVEDRAVQLAAERLGVDPARLAPGGLRSPL
jgi:hypothetical protein